MADRVQIGKSYDSLTTSDSFQNYTKVIIKVDDDHTYTATSLGRADGRTLTIECPFGSQAMADSMLTQMGSFEYSPYSAKGTYLDPSVEVGDTVGIDDVNSKIFSQDLKFGASTLKSDIGAPADEEVDHEFEFKVERERKVERALAGAGRAIKENTKQLVHIDTGMKQLTDYTEDEEGEHWSFAENKIYASVSDNGNFKESFLNLGVRKDSSGNMHTLAQLASDIIELKGHVRIQSDTGGTAVVISGGRLQSTASQTFSGNDTYLNATNTYVASLNVLSGTQYGHFVPTPITSMSTDGKNYICLCLQ